MLGYSSMRKIALFTMILFVWFCMAADFQYAQEEDLLLKARKLYQSGYYDDALNILSQCIEKLQNIVAEKKKVAEAFYLTAKVYYTVGEDAAVEKNLKKVFETYPSFQKEENNLEFKSQVEKVRSSMTKTGKDQAERKIDPVDTGDDEKTAIPDPDTERDKKPVTIVKPLKVEDEKQNTETRKTVITKPVKKKKKKFPWLLVVGGVVVLGALAYFLLFKKEESKVTEVTVRIDLTFAATNLGCGHIIRVNGVEKLNEYMAFNVPGYNDYDLAMKINRTIYVTQAPGVMTIQHEISADYTDYYPSQETWIWGTDFDLMISDFNYQGDNPGPPTLSENYFYTTVAPWHENPTDEWYRIESKSISIIAPMPTSASRLKQRGVVTKTYRIKEIKNRRQK